MSQALCGFDQRPKMFSGLVFGVAVLSAAHLQAGSIAPFTEEAISRGVVYAMQGYPQSSGQFGFGCGFADLDGDGDQDIVIVGAADGHVGLFENNGSGQFSDRSAGSGIPLLTQGSAFVAADYDGDGDLDLYLTQFAVANVLVRNEGNFQFTDVTATAGVGDAGEGKGAAFGDYDGDGWLDLYVCNYTGLVLPPGNNNKLYHNLGNGTFEDVSVAQTVDDPGLGFEAAWFDYDRDGDVDLYLSNDRGHLTGLPNQLWRNDNGQLVNVSIGSGADGGFYSMGLACGDFDGNGCPDLYCTNISSTTPPDTVGGVFPLYLNQCDGSFVESSVMAGVDLSSKVGWSGWGAIFFDFDNNAHQDLYVNIQFEDNVLFACDGTFPCVDIAVSANVTADTGVCPVPSSSCHPSFSSAVADVDNDGDLDLLVNNLAINVELFINHEGQTRKWVKYHIAGQGNNLFAVGADIRVRSGATWQMREILAGGNGYLGQNELAVHFGLDDATVADETVVTWPGGGTARSLTNLPINETWTIFPPERLGDADDNSTVDLDDFLVFAECYEVPFEPGCEIMDFDGNSLVNSSDYDAFLAAFDATPADCDGDKIIDMTEIIQGLADDVNTNGIPDNCECVPYGDVDGNFIVDLDDLLCLLESLRGLPGCEGVTIDDLDTAPCGGDGDLNVYDLIAMLNAVAGKPDCGPSCP